MTLTDSHAIETAARAAIARRRRGRPPTREQEFLELLDLRRVDVFAGVYFRGSPGITGANWVHPRLRRAELEIICSLQMIGEGWRCCGSAVEVITGADSPGEFRFHQSGGMIAKNLGGGSQSTRTYLLHQACHLPDVTATLDVDGARMAAPESGYFLLLWTEQSETRPDPRGRPRMRGFDARGALTFDA